MCWRAGGLSTERPRARLNGEVIGTPSCKHTARDARLPAGRAAVPGRSHSACNLRQDGNLGNRRRGNGVRGCRRGRREPQADELPDVRGGQQKSRPAESSSVYGGRRSTRAHPRTSLESVLFIEIIEAARLQRPQVHQRSPVRLNEHQKGTTGDDPFDDLPDV